GSYLCLIDRADAGPLLLETATTDTPRLRRALAVHWIHRLDEPVPHPVTRALEASDRRLMADAVHARRGRKSPVPEHDAVFVQFDWYQPDEHFTNRRLTDVDRANLSVINDPPPEPEPEPENTAADAIAEAAATPVTERGCGACSSAGGMMGLGWVAMVGLIGLRRRR
ncbi:MAG: MYXO-CTERM domain-containing protein, partial [Myxococcota bacterium]